MAFPSHGDLTLLHRLQQGRLRLGRGAVDFIRENEIPKHRPGLELELVRRRFAEIDLRARDVAGQQVGRELDAAEFALQVFGQRLDRPRLGEAGKPLKKDVPIGQQGNQQLLDHGLLADDRSLHPRPEFEDLVT